MGIRRIFIQNMKYYRKQAGLTQEKLAEAIDMSTSYIGDMEARERFPSAETIDKIAAALEIPVSLLFNERGSPDSLKDTFLKIYGASLKDELSSRILKDINDAKIKLYYFDLAGITPEEMFEILNGKEVSCDNRFLEHKTIYKLEAKK